MSRQLAFAILAAVSLATAADAQASWHRRYPPTSPAPRINSLLAYVESTGQCLLMFGLGSNNYVVNDAWLWNGTHWTASTAARPPARSGSAMVWDGARQRLVLFGGQTVNGPHLQDLWEWDGAQWAARTPAASPPARESHALAFDHAHNVVVLFGGNAGSGFANDTWTWNGTQWQQLAPLQSPAARAYHAMAFDVVAGRVLLYGGNVAQVANDETWSWNGANWTMLTPSTPPFARGAVGMVTDSHRNRIVLYGGSMSDSATWEWNGSQWNSLSLPGPGPRIGFGFAYDASRRETLFFGGYENWAGYHDDTWTYFTPHPADVVPLGSGCAGSAGVPVLANAPSSLPWIGDTLTMRVSHLAASATAALFVTSTTSTAPASLAAYGMPGCDLLLSPLAVEFTPVTAQASSWHLAIPTSTALAGVQLFQQALVLEPLVNAAGAIISNGARIQIGIR